MVAVVEELAKLETSEMKVTTTDVDVSPVQEVRQAVDPEPTTAELLQGVPDGNYKVIACALDLTGRKTTDEICQIAAYAHPKKAFSQYVMPFCDVSIGSAKNHSLKVYVVYGKYRVLRNTRSMKVLKTKSIYSTLLEFLDWLKEMKGSSDGIILAYHDHKFLNIPYFLAKAVKDYKMTEEFGDVVKGVINCARLLPEPKEATKDGKRRSNSLVGLVREAFDDMEVDKLKVQLQSARYRAEWAYKLHAKLMKSEEETISFGDLKGAVATANTPAPAATTDEIAITKV